jgi:acetoin utilization protein AcuB
MNVESWMTRDVVTVSPSLPLIDAYRLFHDYEIRHLPVVHEGELVGILSKRDTGKLLLRNLSAGDMEDLGTVRETMVGGVITVKPGDSVEDAALLMRNRKISSLPVVDDAGELVGIITTDDMLAVLVGELAGREKA